MELVKLRQECTHLVLVDIIMRKSTFLSKKALMIPQFQDLELMNIELIQFNTMMDGNLISKVELRILLVSNQTIYNLICQYRTIAYQY